MKYYIPISVSLSLNIKINTILSKNFLTKDELFKFIFMWIKQGKLTANDFCYILSHISFE
jgi:hypothetical protein